jgi:carbon storage regulator
MLVLTRRRMQTLMIGDSVTITILDIRGGQVRLGVNAPRDIGVHREETFDRATGKRRMPDGGS